VVLDAKRICETADEIEDDWYEAGNGAKAQQKATVDVVRRQESQQMRGQPNG
jgi:hypothetical protein